MAPSLVFLLFLVLSPFSPARGLTVPSKSPPKPTVAVLGATGYVGSTVVKALEKRGEVVLRISRTSEGPNSLAVGEYVFFNKVCLAKDRRFAARTFDASNFACV